MDVSETFYKTKTKRKTWGPPLLLGEQKIQKKFGSVSLRFRDNATALQTRIGKRLLRGRSETTFAQRGEHSWQS